MNTERIRSLSIQGAALLALSACVAFFSLNAIENMQALGLTTGLGFMGQTAGFDISFSVISYDRTSSTFGRVLLVGIANTLAVSSLAIIIATIIGMIVGIFQLLENWPLAKLCRTYIELARNVPLLLQLVFWYTCVLSALPHQKSSLSFMDSVFLNVRGVFMPWPEYSDGTRAFYVACALSITALVYLVRRSRRVQEESGEGKAVFIPFLLTTVGLIGGAWMIFGQPANWTYPVLKGFNFKGGTWLPPEFMALLIGLSLYTAAFIAELVRGGILAVSQGQREAALAIGLTNWQTMKLVMIPQAMRIIVPPLTSQYLNIVKNSSLAVAIAYPDIVSVFTGTTLNQTGRAIEIVAITMGFYLCVSLIISAFMNWYNRRVALVERT
ncbi:ABC transporter permease subunit [Sulfitobacter sp. F26204]|uniref:amino acid ABC transporter permease n=1 Tax=Sulfitobacter sp. F26204 TaxID=2996014 RepID=UPI00225DD9D6|nr:ABC transporter permease subunit [Sulfitobacter sp. F26204]MCX7561356.1 ABC transporter permease subunit [Sulfitobacter sp. F26204]